MADEPLKRLGAQIRKLRRAKDISQEELSNTTGIDRTYLSRIEHGTVNTSVLKVHQIALALEVEVSELFQ